MTNEQLHPSVRAFKQFINQYPLLCEHIHSNTSDVQTLYEKWITDGEDDVYWDTYKKRNQDVRDEDDPRKTHTDSLAIEKDDSGKIDIMKTIMHLTENMDMSNVQKHVEQLSKTVLSVQEIMNQFNSKKRSDQTSTNNRVPEGQFFQWMKD